MRALVVFLICSVTLLSGVGRASSAAQPNTEQANSTCPDREKKADSSKNGSSRLRASHPIRFSSRTNSSKVNHPKEVQQDHFQQGPAGTRPEKRRPETFVNTHPPDVPKAPASNVATNRNPPNRFARAGIGGAHLGQKGGGTAPAAIDGSSIRRSRRSKMP